MALDRIFNTCQVTSCYKVDSIYTRLTNGIFSISFNQAANFDKMEHSYTTLIIFFTYNAVYINSQNLFYMDFSEQYVFNFLCKVWHLHKKSLLLVIYIIAIYLPKKILCAIAIDSSLRSFIFWAFMYCQQNNIWYF